jgi:hypothetical protein
VALIVSASVDDERDHAAITTNNEFAALAIRIQADAVLSELRHLPHFLELSPRQVADVSGIKSYLVNGWNTERILRITAESLTAEALPSGLQWGFPMAYYAVYSVTLAYFRVAGFTEQSHTSVIRKFGSLIGQGKYPQSLSFFASGPRPCVFRGVQHDAGFSTLSKPYDKQTADTMIACFLSGTRKQDLEEKKKDIKLFTKAGKRKRAFRSDDWSQVSERLGRTSLLSLLYRKRIKANYRDIDTFLSPQIDGSGIFMALQQIVDSLSLIHEALIAKIIGIAKLEQIQSTVSAADFLFVRQRFEKVRNAVPNGQSCC